MPHKHTRKPQKADASSFNLPPTALAKPLPAYNKNTTAAASNKRKRPLNAAHDDTPRAFQRLLDMQRSGKRIPNGLDNGERVAKKKRKQAPSTNATTSNATTSTTTTIPKIQPGEKLSEYSARVNQALPIAGLGRKAKSIPGLKERQSKMEKKLQRMQNDWRAEDRKIKDAEQELLDQRDEAEAEDWEAPATSASTARKSKKGKKRRAGGAEADDSDDDPWAKLKELRGKPAAVHDVVKAPPTFTKVPREIFKVQGGARVNIDNVPNAAGSLRKREELGEARRGVIESYRKLMAEKRAA